VPLYASGLRKIRRNLLRVQAGQKPRVEKIGFFTSEQIAQINAARISMGFPTLHPEILFQGHHLYDSRCIKDLYTIDQVMEQIASALSDTSVVDPSPPSVVIRNPNRRLDHRGKLVNDEAVFECSGRHPYADLYSVIPQGDGLKQKTKRR
jgi:hypothetical protein